MRKLAGILVLVLGSLALLGADGGTYQGGTYGSRGASYQAGGVAAGWDTFRVVFTMKDTLDHYIGTHDAELAAADQVYQLGRDVAFAWDRVERFSPLETVDHGLHYWRSSRSNTYALDDSVSGMQLAMFRIDFAAVLPPGCTILDAKLNMVPASSMYTPRSDSLYAVLMTQAADTAWYKTAYLGVPAYSMNYMGHASWTNQVQGTDTGGFANRNYPATSSNAWSPRLVDRKYPWQWGNTWDISKLEALRRDGTKSANTDTLWNNYYTNSHARLSIRNCVQAIVNGETNNGILWYQYGAGGGATYMSAMAWETSTPTGGTPQEGRIPPWVSVTYTTKKHRPLFGTSDLAVVFSTDDGYLVNASYDSVFALRDADFNFTIGMEAFRPNSGANFLTDTQMIALHDRGNEIASHGYRPPDYVGQPDPFGGTIIANYDGLNFYTQGGAIVNYTRGMSQSDLALPGTTGYDSTCFQMDPAWLDSLAIAEGRPDLTTSSRWGVGFHVPNAGISIDGIRAARDVGLSWVRTLPAANRTNPTSGYYERSRLPSTVSSAPGYAVADSLYLGLPHAQGTRPVNMRVFPTSMDLQNIFGATTATYTEDQVKHNLRRALANIKGDGTSVLAIVTHKQKSASQDGLDLDEAGWMADVIEEFGGSMLTWSEYAAAVRSRATPVATPAGFGQAALYKFSAADEQWYRPSGTHYK